MLARRSGTRCSKECSDTNGSAEIRELARDAVRRAEQEIQLLQVRIEHAEAAKARLDQRKDELAEARRRLETLEGVRPLFEELIRTITTAEESRRRAGDRLAALDARSGELPDPVAGDAVVKIAERTGSLRDAAERDLRIASDRLEKAGAALDSADCRRTVEKLDKISQRLVELEAVRDRIETRLGDLRNAEAALPDRIKSIKTVALAEYAWARRVEAQEEWESAAARLDEAEKAVDSEEFTTREQRAVRADGLIIQLGTREEAAERAARIEVRMVAALDDHETSEKSARSALMLAAAERHDAESLAGVAADRLRDAEGTAAGRPPCGHGRNPT